VASFTESQQAGTLTVDFSDTSSGEPTAWSCDFGDGTSSTQQHPSHSYPAAGSYTVTLTASNAGGQDSESRSISVVAPPSVTTIAADTFGRTVGDGWGSAEMGGAYTVLGRSADFDVDGTVGTMLMPVAGRSYAVSLAQTSARDVAMSVRLRSDKPGAGEHIYLVARRQGSGTSLVEYRARLRIGSAGAVFLRATRVAGGSETGLGPEVRVAGLAYAAGDWLQLRAEVSGGDPTTIRIRAWAAGSSEPADWPIELSDATASLQSPGAVGLRSYLASNSNEAPLLLSFDDFLVTDLGSASGSMLLTAQVVAGSAVAV
jgi:PKD repeat protein